MVHEPSGIHRAIERQVLVLQATQIAQHLGLAVMLPEHRMEQKAAGAPQRRGNDLGQCALERLEVR
jgi:hypothetical protein